jgi:acetyltransferase-like isoleucine patch superfamily enzyme
LIVNSVLANASQETAVIGHRSNKREPFQDPINYVARALSKLYSIWVSLTYPFASIGREVSLHYTCRLARSRAHQIKIGNKVFIGKDVWLNVSALEEKDEPVLVIDDGAIVNAGAQISAKNLIHIERDVLVSTGVLIQDHGHAYEDVTKPISKQGITEGGRVRIEQGSWIGRGAAVLCTKGELVIGRNCVVAANAVVMRNCPPYSVVFGNPAMVIRRYDFSKNKWVLGSGAAADSQVDQ